VSDFVKEGMEAFFLAIREERVDTGCYDSCKSYRFLTRKIGFSTRQDRYGLKIYVNQDVNVKKTHFTITPITLLTRLGGILGVGKEFLWIVITLAAFIVTVFRATKISKIIYIL